MANYEGRHQTSRTQVQTYNARGPVNGTVRSYRANVENFNAEVDKTAQAKNVQMSSKKARRNAFRRFVTIVTIAASLTAGYFVHEGVDYLQEKHHESIVQEYQEDLVNEIEDFKNAPYIHQYVVQNGDTLWGLAAEYLGPEATETQIKEVVDSLLIRNETRISNPDVLDAGTKIDMYIGEHNANLRGFIIDVNQLDIEGQIAVRIQMLDKATKNFVLKDNSEMGGYELTDEKVQEFNDLIEKINYYKNKAYNIVISDTDNKDAMLDMINQGLIECIEVLETEFAYVIDVANSEDDLVSGVTRLDEPISYEEAEELGHRIGR